MRKRKFTESRIVAVLKEGRAGIERFDRTFRTELNIYPSNSIEQVGAIDDDGRTQYNENRPRDALGGLPPKQFMSQ